MSKLVRRKKEIGAAMIVALQLLTVTLVGLMLPYSGGPQQPVKAPADSQMSAAPQAQTGPAAPATDLSARRASAVRATKLYEPRASQIFNLATSRAESAESTRQAAQQSMQEGETPNEATLTTDREDYAPFSYVYINGTGFEPGETVNMIVVELDPVQQSFEPWDVVADENGNIVTSWYIFSEEFRGASMQVTATGQTSGLTASATFTDAVDLNFYEDSGRTIKRDAFLWGSTVFARLSATANNRCYRIEWRNPSNAVVQTVDFPPNNGNDDDSFNISASGPSGTWTVNVYEGPNTGDCTFGPSPAFSRTFDVARAVIIGAVPIGSVGGDNFVDQGNPGTVQGVPPGAGLTLDIDSKSAQNKRIFVRFDLPAAVATPGTVVSSAKLRMLLTAAPNSSPSRTHSAHRVTQTWLQSTITWSSPSPTPFNAVATDSQSAGTTNNVLIRWSVTSDVQGFVNTPSTNFGWCVKDATENASGNNKGSYGATEANTPTDKTKGPVLLVDYTPPACTPPSVTLNPSNQTKTYGDPSATFTATASGSPAPTVQWRVNTGSGFTDIGGATSTTLTIMNPTVAMNGYQYQAVFTNSCSPGTATSTTATLTVNPKSASVTADDKMKTYGDANPTLTATVVGEVVGGDTINYSVSTTATQFSNVGPYVITVTLGSNPNYNVTPTSGTLTINQATASVTADPQMKTYGQVNPALTATVVGEVAGGDAINYTLATTALQFSNVGGYPITVTLGSNPNYNVAANNGTLTINQATASVTADPQMKTYGQVNPALTATVVGEVAGGDAINYTLATTALQFSNVGGYPITVTLGSNPNYNVTANNGTLTINQATASVTADPQMKTYGQVNPALTATVVGEVAGGDAINYTLATTALQFSNVGGYPITVTLGSNPNYNVTANNGTLTINQAAATVTANNKSKAYLAPNPTLTATVVGQVTGGDSINYTLSTTATQTSFPGTYPITVTLGSNPNYSVTKTDGTLTIGYGTCTGPNGPGGVILQPIDADGSSIFPRAGRTVPVKFTVCDVNGNPISDPNAVFAGTGGTLTMLSAVRGQVPSPDESAFNDIPDVAFRYSSGIWIFNMATSNLQQNTTYTFRINLANGQGITFVIKIK